MDVVTVAPPATAGAQSHPFPAQTKQARGEVGGIQTDVIAVSFSDKILVTVAQNGRLAHWLHVPLENTNPGTSGYHSVPEEGDDALLPPPELTATTVLGGRAPEWENLGHLYACQIASAIVTKNPNEKRLLVVGLGLETPDFNRDTFFGIVDLVFRCL
ncbi:hypothetical protein LOZ12_001084 [Ophidiomyces ophidiicola]|uniref:Uncharacterized protein n=1 Tax=Ophidiomyces ophidiicola TaxID=1387563 RepID=A0ACB8V669_9EURO|nr:uncharacterized protein LOZ57_001750 [Ophidiomyces ophidiicola]KAI1911747.1 hypothetical protein LOZ64_004625 [Ophidiomyces ophidiicola]KAI1914051.1 hypothetical protein LOZ61_002470 [Ophidiomyces ophidiicola]KAI1929553.1 hypothetical protein LOZ60_001575 [Ophidiomyces ophidiicola]KAI1943407.1 hypothetical protein LOZ62_004313 [Ophidiomyces ophidiicola]KAI1951196.1 hypothetical protein LOZ57_001750 [Ophidiomyces ophidiicola]